MTPTESVYFDGITLRPGSKLRRTCPWCGSVKPDLAVFNNGDSISYHCYGAICHVNGRIPLSGGTPYHRGSGTVEPTEHPDVTPLGIQDYEYFSRRFELTPEHLDYNRVGRDREWYVWPLHDTTGSYAGYLQRRYTGTGLKTLTKWASTPTPVSPIYPYQDLEGDTVCVVEDYISAIKLASYIPTITSLGCELPSSHLLVISRLYPNLIIAMDPDPAD